MIACQEEVCYYIFARAGSIACEDGSRFIYSVQQVVPTPSNGGTADPLCRNSDMVVVVVMKMGRSQQKSVLAEPRKVLSAKVSTAKGVMLR